MNPQQLLRTISGNVLEPVLPSDQIRSFVSIDIDNESVLSNITSVMSSLSAIGGDLRLVERENIHFTLKFLGNIDQGKLAEVKSKLSQVRFEPFQLEIKGAGAFPSLKRMNVIWVGVGEGWSKAEQIFEQTEKVLHEAGFSRETRPFSPHVTIARVRSGRKLDEIGVFLTHLADESFGSFLIQGIRLKQSILSPSGPKYSTLFETAERDHQAASSNLK